MNMGLEQQHYPPKEAPIYPENVRTTLLGIDSFSKREGYNGFDSDGFILMLGDGASIIVPEDLYLPIAELSRGDTFSLSIPEETVEGTAIPRPNERFIQVTREGRERPIYEFKVSLNRFQIPPNYDRLQMHH